MASLTWLFWTPSEGVLSGVPPIGKRTSPTILQTRVREQGAHSFSIPPQPDACSCPPVLPTTEQRGILLMEYCPKVSRAVPVGVAQRVGDLAEACTGNDTGSCSCAA